MSKRTALSAARRKILESAVANHPDGARIRGAAKYRCCQAMQRDGLGNFLVGGEGRMARFIIDPAGRAALDPTTTEAG